MARKYLAYVSSLEVTEPTDLITVYYSSYGFSRITRVVVSTTDTTLPTGQQLEFECISIPNATIGSGGSTMTPQLLDPGDETSVATVHTGDTSLASAASGSSYVVLDTGCYVLQGIDVTFDEPIPVTYVGANAAFVLRLLSTPSGTLHLSASVYFEEEGNT